MSKVCFGIDLGTSSSSISYIVDSPRSDRGAFTEPTTIKFNPPAGASFFHNWQRLPSVVYVEKKGDRHKVMTGFAAAEAARGKLAIAHENLFASVKSDMGTLKTYEDSVHPNIVYPAHVSAEIIKELLRAAEKETGVSPLKSEVVVSVPASFTHSQRYDTLTACQTAGLSIDENHIIDEPIAAFIHTACHQKLDVQLDMKTPQNILMFDLGAGTCDISIFEASYDATMISEGVGLKIVNKAISNYEKLGGDNLDLHIVHKEILPVFCDKSGIDFAGLPEKTKREIRLRLKLTARMIKEEICRQLAHDWGRKKIRQPWSIDSFMIPSLKMKTKKVSDTTNLESFMEIMQPFIAHDLTASYKIADDYFTYSFFGPIFSCLKKAKMAPEDIHGFIFNGGSCHNPVLRKALEMHEGFCNTRFFDTPDLDLSVSKGAALHCYHLQKTGKPLVTPIVSSEIGLYTHGLKKQRLVAAGTPLPFPEGGEYLVNDEFCVPADDMDRVGIALYTGAGGVISSLRLELPEGVSKGEPISIGVKIDPNKVMSITACLRNEPHVKIDAELSNPWTHRIVTFDDMPANDLWIKIRELKRQGKVVPREMMIDLANAERRRGNPDGALEILQRLEDKDAATASMCNIMALSYASRGQRDTSIAYFKKASELEQNNPTYAANCGSQLLENGQVDEALSMLRQAVTLDPDYFFPYYWLGFACQKKGNEEQAWTEFSRARQLLRIRCEQYPGDEQLLGFLRDCDLALGDYQEADKTRMVLQGVRNTRIIGENPENLLAGPDSGIYTEEEIFEDKED